MYEYVRPRLRKAAGQLRYLPRAISLVWAAARGYTIAWAVLLTLQGILPIATVYLTRALVNLLVTAIRAGGARASIQPIFPLAAAIAGVMLAKQVLDSATIWAGTVQAELTTDHIHQLIHEKSLAVDLAFYESPELHDHLHRARAEGGYRPIAVIENLGSLLQGSITLVAMTTILISFGPILPIGLILSTVPALYVALSSSKNRYEWHYRQTAAERRCCYYDWLLTSSETAAEIRLLRVGNHFRFAYQRLRRHLRSERIELLHKQGLGEVCAGGATLFVSGLMIALMVWRAMRGFISAGDLAMSYQAFNQGLALARSVLENVGKLYENSLFLGNLFAFFSLKPHLAEPTCPSPIPLIKKGIQFENVTFRYPGTNRVALQGFSLTLKSGQMAAIVGPNGAGKSTIIKLLCRLYEPERGTILIDGSPLHRFSVEQLRGRISVLFQDPIRFNSTAAENIWFGDLACRDDEWVRQVAAISGADEIIATLPRGFQTGLGRQFSEGTELSTGEWQRIAMARTLFRRAPITLLDEPTSAMDPWTEVAWAEQFRRFAQGRISVLVTHRFTTAMFCDVIHVMAGGQIVESGTHDQLVARGGLYAEGWASQGDGGSRFQIRSKAAQPDPPSCWPVFDSGGATFFNLK